MGRVVGAAELPLWAADPAALVAWSTMLERAELREARAELALCLASPVAVANALEREAAAEEAEASAEDLAPLTALETLLAMLEAPLAAPLATLEAPLATLEAPLLMEEAADPAPEVASLAWEPMTEVAELRREEAPPGMPEVIWPAMLEVKELRSWAETAPAPRAATTTVEKRMLMDVFVVVKLKGW